MGRKAKYSKELKLEIVKRYLKGESPSALANEYVMPKSMAENIRQWARRFEAIGEGAFDYSKTNNSYSKDLKEKIINEYLSGVDSLEGLANKYKISTHEIVRQWIIKYNKGIEIKDYKPKGDVYTMKSRKTTLEERLEIVNYVLANNNDYKGAADKYSVPYANIYNWVKKYNEAGENGLSDSRGRHSSKEPKHELTDIEKKDIEIEKLKRELERSKMVIEVLKKKHRNTGKNGKRFSLVRQEDKYETIDEFKEKHGFTVDFLCKTLEIPRSSYYKWKNRAIPKKEIQDNELANIIIEYNETYNGILGYRRMTMYINHFNQSKYSIKYIHRLMKVIHVHARIRRKHSNYVKVKPEQVGENILNRNFEALWQNQKWCTDVTEFKVIGQKQKIYLSAIIDLYDRRIVSYVLSNSNNNKLVFDTFDLALKANPNVKPIFHSDRGFQYTSKQFKIKLDQAGMIQSMSRIGRCIDNGPMEGFWGTLKSEMFYGLRWDDETSLREAIIKYINFYNNERLQAKLKGMTPNQFGNHANPNLLPLII